MGMGGALDVPASVSCAGGCEGGEGWGGAPPAGAVVSAPMLGASSPSSSSLKSRSSAIASSAASPVDIASAPLPALLPVTGDAARARFRAAFTSLSAASLSATGAAAELGVAAAAAAEGVAAAGAEVAAGVVGMVTAGNCLCVGGGVAALRLRSLTRIPLKLLGRVGRRWKGSSSSSWRGAGWGANRSLATATWEAQQNQRICGRRRVHGSEPCVARSANQTKSRHYWKNQDEKQR